MASLEECIQLVQSDTTKQGNTASSRNGYKCIELGWAVFVSAAKDSEGKYSNVLVESLEGCIQLVQSDTTKQGNIASSRNGYKHIELRWAVAIGVQMAIVPAPLTRKNEKERERENCQLIQVQTQQHTTWLFLR